MHADEVLVSADLVRRLLAAQFPAWASLPLERIPSDGTDNAIFRLGDALSVRLPRIPSAALQAEKEQRWLPLVAPYLPLPVPEPIASGEPGEGYEWPWSVCRWVEGERVTPDTVDDPYAAAADLAAFVVAMRGVDLPGGPGPGDHNFGRGRPLAQRDGYVRAALAELDGEVDVRAATKAWEAALAAPAWEGPPVWIHGDLHAGNVLMANGRLSAVIDFGGLGVGDPACDVIAAWTFVAPEARETFRDAVGCDDATWERGRGWALSMGLITLPYYRDTNASIVAMSRAWVDAALHD